MTIPCCWGNRQPGEEGVRSEFAEIPFNDMTIPRTVLIALRGGIPVDATSIHIQTFFSRTGAAADSGAIV